MVLIKVDFKPDTSVNNIWFFTIYDFQSVILFCKPTIAAPWSAEPITSTLVEVTLIAVIFLLNKPFVFVIRVYEAGFATELFKLTTVIPESVAIHMFLF